MSRFPPIPAADLTSDQKEIYNELKSIADSMFSGKNFTYIRPHDGAFVGPFAAFLYTPRPIASHYLNLAASLSSMPGFPSNARETAILATGEHFGAIYETYAHKAIAVTTGALSEGQVEDILAGKQPRDGDEGMQVAWEVARALCGEKGALREKLWEKASGIFGREGTAALIQYVGVYAYTCMLLNAADVPVPE